VFEDVANPHYALPMTPLQHQAEALRSWLMEQPDGAKAIAVLRELVLEAHKQRTRTEPNRQTRSGVLSG
jgi:hypothetical protein